MVIKNEGKKTKDTKKRRYPKNKGNKKTKVKKMKVPLGSFLGFGLCGRQGHKTVALKNYPPKTEPI